VWAVGDAQSYFAFDKLVAPLFVSNGTAQNSWAAHTIKRYDVVSHFNRPPAGELRHMDFRLELHKVQCPTLVLNGGSGDVMTPPETAHELADALPRDLVRFELLAHCRHGVFRDDPDAAEMIIRSFIADVLMQLQPRAWMRVSL
jgi:proline iminopeptidase